MIKIYNRNMELLAYAEQAYSVSYEMPFNSIWRASFTLPAKDEKIADCKALNFVELYDESEYIGLFRIMPQGSKRSSSGAEITYECEHVLATLIDDVLFQYHTIGGAEVLTVDTLQYIMSKQSTVRWQLGECDFEHEFEYNFENDNLLGALFAIPKPFLGEYMWTWNTQVYPWTLNLVKPSEDIEAYIRYGINMQGIEKYEDPTDLCTRLYPLGYGEGVNQLTIAEVNGGLPYIDADTVSQYGIVAKTWVDRSIESAETLKARAQALLEEMKTPRITYRVDASELYKITKDELDKFKLATLVRVIDEELGIDYTSRVVKYSKGDLYGNPSAVSLEIANKTQDIASSLSELESRQRINETHAQGATNINVYNLAENCDPTHPARFKIWIPDEAVRINKVSLTYSNEPFRANSKSAASDGEVITTIADGNSYIVDGNGSVVLGNNLITGGMILAGSVITGMATSAGGGTYNTSYAGSHDHGGAAGSHNHGNPDNNNTAPSITTDGSHRHTVEIPPHTHDVLNHSHYIDHEHKLEIPPHVHELIFGIHEGTKATSNGILVDGNLVPGSSTSVTNLDLVDYLDLDSEGKIKRGQFHEIEIIPNRNSRIVATIVTQFFVNSRGGGSY